MEETEVRPRRNGRNAADYAALNRNDTRLGIDFSEDVDVFRRRLEEKCVEFAPADLWRLSGEEFTLESVQRNGISKPIFIAERSGLGMSVPGPGFTVRDVSDALGSDYPIDVIDVATQTEERWKWTLGKWAKYFHRPKTRQAHGVLNVISLEFSGTPMEALVQSPQVIRQLDWIDIVWPGRRHAVGEYPRVQLYCLMSVAGSWTDFHIDFGGTSVWYHVHTGRKTFLFIPPTEENLKAYEAWTTSSEQAVTWLPDTAKGCFQVDLEAGNTLIIPTGWIHAVFTPADSLVFGGNFLHGYQLPVQLRIFEAEMATKVAKKYRFPYFEHMQWYAAAYYLQFCRLPSFPALLREAVQLAAGDPGALELNLDEDPASRLERRERLAAEFRALGVSLHEIQGIPALITTLAHIQRTRNEASAPAAGRKLRLKFSGANAAPATATTSRIKGSIQAKEIAALQGVDAEAAKLAQFYAAAVTDDDADVFPAKMAALEASIMADCKTPEDLLAELTARMDVMNDGYEANIVAVLGDAAIGSTLRRHNPAKADVPVVSALAVNDMHNVPKTEIQSLPVANHVGGFGLYDGTVPTEKVDDVTTSNGAGYSYNEDVAAFRGTRKLVDTIAHDELEDLLGTDSEEGNDDEEDEAYKEEGAVAEGSSSDDEDLVDDDESDYSSEEPEEGDDDLVVGERGADEDDWVEVEETDEHGEVVKVKRRRGERSMAPRQPGAKSKRYTGIIEEDDKPKKKRARHGTDMDVFDTLMPSDSSSRVPLKTATTVVANTSTRMLGATSRIRQLAAPAPSMPSAQLDHGPLQLGLDNTGADDGEEIYIASEAPDAYEEMPVNFNAPEPSKPSPATTQQRQRKGAYAKAEMEQISVAPQLVSAADLEAANGNADDDVEEIVYADDADGDLAEAAFASAYKPPPIPALKGVVRPQLSNKPGVQGSALLRDKMKEARKHQRR